VRRAKTNLVVWHPVLILGMLCIFPGCTAKTTESVTQPDTAVESDLVTLQVAALPPGSLELMSVETARIPLELQVTGRIGLDENRTSRVGCLVGGRVVNVLAAVGDLVKNGTLLAQINSHDAHDARSEYAKAVAELQRRRVEQEFAKNARNRASRLYELKAISLEQLQRAEANLSSAEIEVTVAQAEVNRVEESLHHMGIPIESALQEYAEPAEKKREFEEEELIPVLAPMGGTVMQRYVTPGAVVTPASDLFLVSDLTVLWVQAEVPETNLHALRPGLQVGITVQAYPERVFPGRISLVGTALNPNTRTVPVRCEVREFQGSLKPEMYATIRIDLGEGRDGIMIPLTAIQDVDGQNTVFVRQGEGSFRARKVRLGYQTASHVEILEGLSAGDAIVTVGSLLVKSELLKRRFAVE
jgi:cobalt-zinc-cadmium efflux system membrane fusion protein